MKELIKSLNINDSEVPLFMSCTTFEYPEAEYILYNGEVRLLFEVMDEIPMGDDTPRFFRHIQHVNGTEDYVVIAQCLTDNPFEGMSVKQAEQEIESILDELQAWFIAEVIDLDNYE